MFPTWSHIFTAASIDPGTFGLGLNFAAGAIVRCEELESCNESVAAVDVGRTAAADILATAVAEAAEAATAAGDGVERFFVGEAVAIKYND